MKLFHLRHVDWIDSQLIYHAQPLVNVEGINILADLVDVTKRAAMAGGVQKNNG